MLFVDFLAITIMLIAIFISLYLFFKQMKKMIITTILTQTNSQKKILKELSDIESKFKAFLQIIEDQTLENRKVVIEEIQEYRKKVKEFSDRIIAVRPEREENY